MYIRRQHDFVRLNKNLGACNRTIRFLRVTTSASPSPTRVPCPIPQTRTFQVVRFSGISSSTSAIPSGFVSREPIPQGRVRKVFAKPLAEPQRLVRWLVLRFFVHRLVRHPFSVAIATRGAELFFSFLLDMPKLLERKGTSKFAAPL